MRIKEAKIYFHESGVSKRNYRNTRHTMEKVPPGLNGMFTHAGGLPAQRPDEVIEFVDDTEYTTYRSTLRLITGGPVDAYADFSSGFHRDDLEFEAKQFMADIAPMLIDVDAFDSELIWQKLWYTQHFFYTGRGIVDKIDNMLWNLVSRSTSCSARAAIRYRPTVTLAAPTSTSSWGVA